MRILFKPLLWIWIMILTSNYKNKEWVLNSLFMMYYLAKLPKEITKKYLVEQGFRVSLNSIEVSRHHAGE